MENLLLLAGLSVVYAVATRRVERLRRAVDQDRVPNMLNVWQWAAITVLPLNVVWLSVVIGYAAEWPSRKAVRGGRPWKYLYSCASYAASATVAAFLLHRGGGGVAGYAAAVPAFMVINPGLIAVAILAEGKRDVLRMFRTPRRHLQEVQTILLGIGLGITTMLDRPAALIAGPIVAPALLWVIQRRAARSEVVEAQAYDPGTKMWREDLWMLQAADLVRARARDFVSVLVIQPARAGREQLIGAALDMLIRETDIRGRYGDRSVIVATIGGAPAGALVICERIRRRLEEMGLDCAVGCSTSAGAGLPAMVQSALEDVRIRRYERDVLDRH